MLTFLRKIRKSLIGSSPAGKSVEVSTKSEASAKEGGSTRKYLLYAIGEILLVVIGILIALQINNWNEYHKEREKEKEVLEDIMNNLIRNNEIINSSLKMLDRFDESTDIILSTIRNNDPYIDTLNGHFFHSTRTGGLLFPFSTEGYESLKNAGFDIILSETLKDQTLELFEVTYKTIKEKTRWTMDMAVVYDEYFHTIFTADIRDEYIPINYQELLKDQRYKGLLVNIKEMLRGWYVEDVKDALKKSEHLVQLIQEKLGEK